MKGGHVEYRQLGNSGLKVSKLVIGTITVGARAGFEKASDIDDPAQARRLFDVAFDAGVNMVDTPNLYSMGGAEELVGEALKDKRDEVLIASKVRMPSPSRGYRAKTAPQRVEKMHSHGGAPPETAG